MSARNRWIIPAVVAGTLALVVGVAVNSDAATDPVRTDCHGVTVNQTGAEISVVFDGVIVQPGVLLRQPKTWSWPNENTAHTWTVAVRTKTAFTSFGGNHEACLPLVTDAPATDAPETT